ncbi:MAG: glycosyltransferase family 4 protein [Candidatus Hydrogenedentes bacterium]|nr:glycosyltransferase family 4 protein [Candidatus Hydrogenedentota bacterium]
MSSASKRIRVLFLTLYPDLAASPRYRVAQFLPHLRKHGMECAVASAVTEDEYSCKGRPLWYHVAELRHRVAQMLEASHYDVVFLQKAITTAYVRGNHTILRRRARRLVYDIDDAVHLSPPSSLRGARRIVEDRAQVRKLMAMSDLVLAGNAWLRQEAENAGGNAVFFPTVVDTDRFVPSQTGSPAFRVGWIGNPSTTPHLAAAADALESMNDTEVIAIGADPHSVALTRATVVPWSYETEVASIQSLSVGIMPLPKDEWTRGKCALKALQYMACAIPCVATPYGAVTDIIQHGENGLFADSTQEWRDAFERLRDPRERARIGDAGRQTVIERFSLASAAPRLVALLEGVA